MNFQARKTIFLKKIDKTALTTQVASREREGGEKSNSDS